MTEKRIKQPKVRFRGFVNDWEQRKIGDFYTFKNGLNKEKEFFGKGTPIVNFIDVFHKRGIYFENLKGLVQLTDKEINNFRVQRGDIFFTRTSETIEEIGYPSVMLDEPKDTVFSGFVLRGRAIGKDPLTLLFKRYVFFTKAFRQEMEKKSSMTTRALTSGTALKEMYFNFPTAKVEQDKIGDFFVQLDHLITLHQNEVENLKVFKKTMLSKMFPKNGETTPKIRFKGFTDVWKQRKLGEVCPIFLDGDWIESKDQSDSGVRLIQTGNIGVGTYLNKLDKSKWVSEDTFDRLHCEEVFPGDILISRLPDPAGRACIIPETGQKMITAVDVTIARTSEECDSPFLLQYLCSEQYFRDVNNALAGSTRQRISRGNLEALNISIPSNLEEQKKIGKFFRSLDHLITLHQRELDNLGTVKNTMLSKMFV